MQTRIVTGPASVLLLFWAGAAVATAADGWHTDFNTAQAEARRLNRPLLVHFYADWCGPCRQMERDVLHNPGVLSQIGSTVVAVKVNSDRSPELASRYNITALPTDLYLEPDGRLLMQSTGYRSSREYVAALSRASVRYGDLLAARAPRPSQPAAGDAAGRPPATLTADSELKPMIDGYCPVTLWENRKWQKGSPRFAAEHRGQVYHMASREQLDDFQANPERYAPRFLGCDPVVVWESDRAVLGSTRYGAFYDDELFLFVTDENRQSFKKDPDKFVRTRVVLHTEQIEPLVR